MATYSFFKDNFPYIGFFDITPNDGADMTTTPRSIYVGGAGNIVAVDSEGNQVTFSNVPAGTLLRIQPVRIRATNTTATNIIGLI